MALNTGMKIARRTWDIIPMPDLVIARVNELGSNQPALIADVLKYKEILKVN
jgi:hypothetical protein